MYPDPPAPKGSAGQAAKESSTSSQVSPESGAGEDDDVAEADIKLEPIQDEEEPEEEGADEAVDR